MALYRNLLPSRLILSNNHVANPAGSKSYDGHPTDTVEISDDDLKLPGIKVMLGQNPPALELCKAPTAAEVKAAQQATAATAAAGAKAGDGKPADPVTTPASDKPADLGVTKPTDKK